MIFAYICPGGCGSGAVHEPRFPSGAGLSRTEELEARGHQGDSARVAGDFCYAELLFFFNGHHELTKTRFLFKDQ